MNSGNIKFVYFDLGGVSFGWDQAFATVAKKFDVSKDRFVELFDANDEKLTKGYMTPQKFWEICRRDLDIKNGERYDFLASWAGDFVPFLSTHELVKKVAGKYGVGIISNIYKGMYPLLIEKGLVSDIKYQSIILSCEVGMRKPEKEIYKFAQEKAGVAPEEILFIDDSEKYLQPVKEMGWSTILFDIKNPEKSVGKIKKFLNI